jgi:hypothetical protein
MVYHWQPSFSKSFIKRTTANSLAFASILTVIIRSRQRPPDLFNRRVVWDHFPPASPRRRKVAILLPFKVFPGRTGQPGRFFNRQPIRFATVVMDIIHQRDGELFAHRQQVGYGIAYIIVFQGQAAPDIFRQIGKHLAKTHQGQGFVAIDPTSMKIDDIGSNRLRQLGLVIQFSHGIGNYRRVRR